MQVACHPVDVVQANFLVCRSGLPNFMDVRILVPTKFNVKYLERKLRDYQDKNLLNFVHFGFAVDHDGSEVTVSCSNHGATSQEFSAQIHDHLQDELVQGLVFGPLE